MRKFTERDLDTMARTLYGEAEANNAADAKAIGWVIVNRAALPNWPDSVAQVCLQPWQFSCWNPGDPNRDRILNARSSWFERCREIALGVLNGEISDPTSRATHYYATFVKTPKWAKGHTPVYRVTHTKNHQHLFFNDIDTKPPATRGEALDQVRPLSSSKTVAGGSVAGAAVVASEVVNDVKDQIEPLALYADSLRVLFLLVAVAGIALTIWAAGFRPQAWYPVIPGWWKVLAICAAAIWLSLMGYWLKGLVEEAGQAEVLREQIKVNRAAQDKINAVATAAETQLADNRRKEAELNRKWKAIRETKSHAVCTLDDDTLGLLRDAAGPAGLLPR